jgi:serine protease Do
MNDGMRRFAVLGGVFVFAFLAVFVFRKVQGGEGFFDIFKFWERDRQENFIPESYTLSNKPALSPGEVEFLSALDGEFARLTEAVVPSVVSLHTEGIKRQLMQDWFGRVWVDEGYPVRGIGSGVIVSEEGHVVTNEHVTNGKSKISVTMHDGKTYPATVIGEDRALDIAVIRIKADRDFKPLKFGDSGRVRQGQQALAIGNPFGLGETVTRGIISAKERTISDRQRDLFQTDAAINPGNSGGPLINIYGEIIGINAAIYSPDTEDRGFVGIGFSIPANDVREVFEQILAKGRATRGWLGVRCYDWNPLIREKVGWDETGGVYIVDVVPDSPAQKAGLQADDVVVSYNGKPVANRVHFFSEIQRTPVDREVTIEVWRSGEEVNLTATVIDAEDSESLTRRREPGTRSATDERIIQDIGIKVQELTLLQRTRGGSGVLITAVSARSQAARRGLRPGDLILEVNNVRVEHPIDFYARLVASAAVQQTSIAVQRGRKIYRVKPFERVARMESEE